MRVLVEARLTEGAQTSNRATATAAQAAADTARVAPPVAAPAAARGPAEEIGGWRP